MMPKRIIIIGAGPTGLGAAYRLQELGYRNWSIYEKNDYVGGLSASFKDREGFTWDVGGHVMFSHYKYFDDVVQKLLGNDYLEHQRKSWIRLMNRWIPYPFQNNIRYLSKETLLECLLGLHEVSINKKPTENFKEWIFNTFGKGIAKYFMIPYNYKVWAVPLEQMGTSWIDERVSVVDFQKVIANVILAKDDVSWGPNTKFKFPMHGGTGGLFSRFIPHIKDHLLLGKKTVGINLKNRIIRFSDGSSEHFDILINTSPLDEFVAMSDDAPETVRNAAKGLASNSVYVVGLGIRKKLQSTKCWMYFPEDTAPFYRVTHFSKYSPFNVPEGDVENYSSYMCETSFSNNKSVSKDDIIKNTVEGLSNTGVIENGDAPRIVSEYFIEVEKAYPIPTLGRNEILDKTQPYLEKHSIFSRGRFGAWKYEIGNVDHSVMMGVEIVDRLLNDKKETTWS